MTDTARPGQCRSDPETVVSAVILTYQRQDLLTPCLNSVEQTLHQLDCPTEIVVVDNASPHNRATARIAELCPRARIVTLAENRGYAGGVHAGLEVAHGEWILTIGDDATIEPPAVAAMLATGRSGDDIGSVAAKMLFADRSAGDLVNSAGLDIDRLGSAVDRLVGAPAADAETEPTEVFGTSGGAALYRRAMLDQIGGFDTSFGVYLEDADVAWRARMAGWRCVLEPRAVVRHHHSATTRHRSDYKYFHVGRNRVRMLAKNATRWHLLRYAPLIVLYDLAYVAYALAVDHTTAPLRGRVQGLRDWRRYRATQFVRRPVQLAPPRGLLSALRRNSAVQATAGAGVATPSDAAATANVAMAPPTEGAASIDAVFLTFNSRDQALKCIRHTREPELIASIVAVDNASTDGTADAVRAAHPDVMVLALERRVGLAAALNMGAKLGSAPFVLYLNDDVFAEPGAIRTLLATLESRPDAVAAGGRLVEPDLVTQDQYRPRPFPTPAIVVARLFGLERLWPRNPWTCGHLRRPLDDHTTVEVDQPAGACLLVRRPVVEQTGGWDERYWFWYEDVDFSRRLAQHGVSLYTPAAPFRHVGGATVRRWNGPQAHGRYFFGILQYSRTHFSRSGRAIVALAVVVVSLGRAALRVRPDPAGARIYVGAARGAIALMRGREITRFDGP